MPDAGLDAEKLRLLDEWAEGLQRDDRPEVAAAGRAILMLVQEVERLHVHLWDQHLNPDARPTVDAGAPTPVEPEAGPLEEGAVEPARPEQDDDGVEPQLERSLRRRLLGRRDSASLDR